MKLKLLIHIQIFVYDYISNNDPLITLKSSPLNSRKNQQDHDLTIH